MSLLSPIEMEELKHQLDTAREDCADPARENCADPARQNCADPALEQVSLQKSSDESEDLNRNLELIRPQQVELDAEQSSSPPDSEYVQQLEHDLEESRRRCSALELQQVLVQQELAEVGQVRSPSPHINLAWNM